LTVEKKNLFMNSTPLSIIFVLSHRIGPNFVRKVVLPRFMPFRYHFSCINLHLKNSLSGYGILFDVHQLNTIQVLL